MSKTPSKLHTANVDREFTRRLEPIFTSNGNPPLPYKTEHLNVTTIDPQGGDRAVIVHGVNCQGAMGSGIAGALARKWPAVRSEYLEYVSDARKEIPMFESFKLLGRSHLVEVEERIAVINGFTQDYFGADGKRYASLTAIVNVLAELFTRIQESTDIAHADGVPDDDSEFRVYMPRIGCGLGGLDWDTEVEPLVNELCRRFPAVDLTVIEF